MVGVKVTKSTGIIIAVNVVAWQQQKRLESYRNMKKRMIYMSKEVRKDITTTFVVWSVKMWKAILRVSEEEKSIENETRNIKSIKTFPILSGLVEHKFRKYVALWNFSQLSQIWGFLHFLLSFIILFSFSFLSSNLTRWCPTMKIFEIFCAVSHIHSLMIAVAKKILLKIKTDKLKMESTLNLSLSAKSMRKSILSVIPSKRTPTALLLFRSTWIHSWMIRF